MKTLNQALAVFIGVLTYALIMLGNVFFSFALNAPNAMLVVLSLFVANEVRKIWLKNTQSGLDKNLND